MIKQKVAHLYIHIPFCKNICSYCDFIRKTPISNDEIDSYLNKIIKQINNECINLKFKTIYIGGGTPNCLTNQQLDFLLINLKKYLVNKYEFTIELNPEFVNDEQIKILMRNQVNRVSLGVQSCNNQILKDFKRIHNLDQVKKSIKILKDNNLNNISIDFIYGYNLMKNSDIIDDIRFVRDYKINHVSFYSLELKTNSLLNKKSYKEDLFLIEQQLKLIIKEMKKIKYQRYEVSNWCVNKKYQSLHNLAYWNYYDWKAIGIGGYGNENMNYYHYDWNFKKYNNKLTKKDYYQHILIMGLRLIDGIDLSIKHQCDAYNFFKKKLDHNKLIIKNNHVKVKNINLLDDVLLSII